MRDTGMAVAFIAFVVVFVMTDGFRSNPVASTDVTVRQAAPTVNDDIDRGFLPGYQWVDQAGQDIYGLVSGGDGTADWDLLNGAGGGAGGHTIQDEGIDLTARTNLNFIGTGINCADNAGSDASDCTIGSAIHEYGVLFTDDTVPDAQVLATAGVFEVILEFDQEGESSAGVTIDTGDNDITLVNAGTYAIGYSASYAGSATREYDLEIFIDGVGQSPSMTRRTLSAAGSLGVVASGTIIVTVTGGEVVDLRAAPENNGDSITVFNGILAVNEIQDFGSDDLPALADDSVWVGSATSVATASAVPDCNGANVNRIQYDTATNAWSCETDPIDVTADITGIVPIGNGGTGQVTATEDGVLMGDTSAFIVTVVPDCQDSGGNHLNFNNTTDAWDCGTSVRAIDISDDTNLTASDGAVLTGDDISTTLGTSVDVTSEITGIVPVGNGGTGQVTATADGVLIGNASIFVISVLPDCQDSGGNHLNYNNTTDAWDCGTSVRAIDISDDTNLVAGTSLTLTDDTLSVDDDFLANDGDVGTGVYDFGGADSFEIPNGAGGTTVDATGEVTIDSTSETLNYYDGTVERVLSSERSFGITVPDPTDSEDLTIFRSLPAITVVWEDCVLTGTLTPSLSLTLRFDGNRDDTGTEINTGGRTVTNTTTGDNDVSFDDPTIPADSFIWMESTAQSGTVDTAHCTWGYNIDP